MTPVTERALAALARADEVLSRERDRPETEHEWAARAPNDPEGIARWLREAPPVSRYHEPPPPPDPAPAPAVDRREVADLKATVELLRREIHMLSSGKERRRRKMGRAYLTADTGGR